MIAIELNDVVKQYPDFKLGPVDLRIKKGEFFGIFGPPSSGKTTLLKLMLGLVTPDSGSLNLSGEPADNLDVDQRDISMVFQNLALFPHMNGRENIIFPLAESNTPKDEVEKRLEFVSNVLHVSHILHKNPSQMSGGERQRIALGRAFAGENQITLLDEPIAALDARLREEMRVELKRLQREKNQTFVYVSHDEEEVMAISDRVAVVIEGRIAQIGTPDEVYSAPNTLAVAKVIGTPPMNIFEGSVSNEGLFICKHFSANLPKNNHIISNQILHYGVRPEDIWLSEGDNDKGIMVKIMSCEPLGAYTILNAMLDEKLIIIRVSGQLLLDANVLVNVVFDQRRVHLFGKNGERI